MFSRPLLVLALVICAWPTPALAQAPAHAEVAVSYDLARDHVAPDDAQVLSSPWMPFGIRVDVTQPPRALGAVGMVGFNTYSPSVTFGTNSGGYCSAPGVCEIVVSRFSALGGVRASTRGATSVFGQLLAGVHRDVPVCTEPSRSCSLNNNVFPDGTYFVIQPGGGADLAFIPHVALRLQADFEIHLVHTDRYDEVTPRIVWPHFSVGAAFLF